MSDIFLWSLALMVTIYACYLNLPGLAARFCRKYRSVLGNGSLMDTVRRPDPISSGVKPRIGRWRVMDRISQYLRLSGDDHPESLRRYIQKMALATALPFAAALLFDWPFWHALLASIASASLINAPVNHRIRQRKEALERSFFKIYRFIDSQVQAGIKPTDVLKGIHESIDDPAIQHALIRFSARFTLTLDLDEAMEEIRHSLDGKDIETLGTHLRQVLATGTAGRSFQRTEELLFSRYFAILQRQSASIRNQLLLSAILMMLPTILLFLMPLIHEAVQSLSLVFG